MKDLMMTQQLVDNWPISAEMWRRSKESLAGGVSSGARLSAKPHPIFMQDAHGATVTDVDSNNYIDFTMGWGPIIVGHGHPDVTDAVVSQAGRTATYGTGHEFEFIAAERILSHYPAQERLLWSNSGTEATQIALRLARAKTRRTKIIKFVGNYHGWSDSLLMGYRPDEKGSFTSVGTLGQSPSVLNDVVLVEWGNPEKLKAAMELHGEEIAAVFMDAVMSNSGTYNPPVGYFNLVRKLCDRYGSLFILDEVLTGFRVAQGGAVELFQIQPDIIVLAKAIANGYPVSAVLGSAEIVDQITHGVNHSGTYNGNPVSLAASAATLEILSDTAIFRKFETLGKRLQHGIQTASAEVSIPMTVNRLGGLLHCIPGVQDAKRFSDFLKGDYSIYERLAVELLRRGVFVPFGGRLYLCSEHTEEHVDYTIKAYQESLEQIS